LFSAIIFLSSFVFLTDVNLAHAATCAKENIRWAASSNRIYVSGSVVCTLSEIDSLVSQNASLTLEDPTNKVWFLGSNLILEQGATLDLRGGQAGGDVNWLKLKSNSSGYVEVKAYWGSINIESTRISSWTGSSVDTNYSDGRAFIRAISYLESDGITLRESRMDIKNSDIGYLGYYAAESYGLAWKVRGVTPGIYDKVEVYGDIIGNRIHHNYFGVYTFGAYGGQWLNNEVDNNIQYGFDPHDDSDFLSIEGNFVHHNGNHGIICSQRCDHLVIRNNSSSNNVGNGIMLHRNANDSLVELNTVNDNGDSGLAIFDSHRNLVRDNISLRNGKYGIRLSVGASYNRVEENDFGWSRLNGIILYKGSDQPTSGDGRPKNNLFVNNEVHHSRDYAIVLKDADYNSFADNNLYANRKGIYVRGVGNTFD